MPTEKEKWEEKKRWVELFDTLTPEDIERERREAKGLGAKIVATLKEWLFKIMGFFIAPFGWALMWGLEKFSDVFEPELAELSREQLEQLKEIPDLPPAIRKQVDYLLGPRSAIHLSFLLPLSVGMLLGIIMGMMRGPMSLGSQFINKMIRSTYLREDDAVQALFRGIQTEEDLRENLAKRGYHPTEIDAFIEVSRAFPPLVDMIRFADFGAFDPTIIEMWREYYDAPGWIVEPLSKLGLTVEWINKYWFSHWRQPGRFELGEMHRRGLIDDTIVRNAYLTQGFSAFWQDNLLELVKEPWTRVDVRRMWEMRIISEERLRKAYHALGYYDEWLEGMVLWTKVYVAFPDLMARYTKGWINLEDVKSELRALGMPEERIEEMIETKVKKAAETLPEGEESREFTKSEILDGYRRRMFSEEETRDMLTGLNYGPEQVSFYIDREDLKREQEYKDAFVKRYKTLYVEGVMPWPDVAEALSIVGLTEAEISELKPLWEAEKLWKVARPTRANLDKFLKEGVIDETTYRDEMRGMGYSDRYIDWFLAVAPSEEEA